jgi:hypothetical protein
MTLTLEQKRLTDQHLRYLREVWDMPSISHVIHRLANDAYVAAPSAAQRKLASTGQSYFQVVIHPAIRDMLVEMQGNLRLASMTKTVVHLMANAEARSPCPRCMHVLMNKSGSERVCSVSGTISREDYARWTDLRYGPFSHRNTHGHTKRETLERLICEAWLATQPPMRHVHS